MLFPDEPPIDSSWSDDDSEAVWKALANRTRRQILDQLVAAPQTTGELANNFADLSRFAIMQHLTVLETAGLVIAEKQGRSRLNHLNPIPLQHISDRWISRDQRPLAEALVDLKRSLESTVRSESTEGQDNNNGQE